MSTAPGRRLTVRGAADHTRMEDLRPAYQGRTAAGLDANP